MRPVIGRKLERARRVGPGKTSVVIVPQGCVDRDRGRWLRGLAAIAEMEQAEGDDAYRSQSDPPSEFLHWFSARPPHHAPKRFFQFHQ
ncbi:MAG TPA: hypothetical protein PLX26_14920, partial [Candidatus Competibacteraceae bacterium]|nr:hypothetical protein [Candidatus Competibacteraceae bacterium]